MIFLFLLWVNFVSISSHLYVLKGKMNITRQYDKLWFEFTHQDFLEQVLYNISFNARVDFNGHGLFPPIANRLTSLLVISTVRVIEWSVVFVFCTWWVFVCLCMSNSPFILWSFLKPSILSLFYSILPVLSRLPKMLIIIVLSCSIDT